MIEVMLDFQNRTIFASTKLLIFLSISLKKSKVVPADIIVPFYFSLAWEEN
jgi:hypothetical protein